MTAGLNSVLLLQCLLCLEEKGSVFLRESLEGCHVPYLNGISSLFGTKTTDRPLDRKRIEEVFGKYPPISHEDALACTGAYASVFGKIVLSGETGDIEAADHFLLLSIIVLLQKIKEKTEIVSTVPGIGMTSPTATMHLFKNKKIRLDAAAESVPPPLARILLHYFYPFTVSYGMRIREVREITVKGVKPCVRLIRGEGISGCGNGYDTDEVFVCEMNIDDSTPEVLAEAMQAVLSAGALDYFVVPAGMKKGRTGFFVQVLTKPEDIERIADLLLTGTSTFGIRFYRAKRFMVYRKIRKIETPFGTIRVKEGYKGRTLIKQMPEFDDLLEISRGKGVPIQQVYNRIMGEIKKQLTDPEQMIQ